MDRGPLVVAAATEAVLDQLPDAAGLLTAAERRRMATFHRVEDRRGYLAAHALARVCAARLAGVPGSRLTLVQRCPRCDQSDHGRPSLREFPELHLSLSHTTGYVAAMAGWSPVGVDVERLGRVRVDAALATLTLTPAERARIDATPDPDHAFLRLWVRKEALVKLGELSLDALTAADLSQLPIAEAPSLPHRWHGLHLLDWSWAKGDALGAAVAGPPPKLRQLDEEHAWLEDEA